IVSIFISVSIVSISIPISIYIISIVSISIISIFMASPKGSFSSPFPVIFPFLRPLFERLNFNMVAPSSFTTFFIDVLKKVKKDRQKNDHKNRVDFLQLMVDSQISGNIPEEAKMYKALTDKEILTQAIVFIFAGFETTSTTLSFLSHCLATNPDVQQKLQEEIDATLPDQKTPTPQER
uniref:Uncharacterized protein n=1 Tax=Anolis carolinensis TaxID=28377 RepID=H9G5G9_ANOCA